MYNRAEIVDQNFIRCVNEEDFPEPTSMVSLSEANLTAEHFMDLFESQMMSRHLDLQTRLLKNDNQSYYTIGSSGHEGNVVLGSALKLSDMVFLHYRSGAFMMQRSKQLPGSTPIYDTLLSFVASSDDPISSGRHKVFGSVPLNVPPQTSTIASHLPKAMGAAFSIGKGKEGDFKRAMPDDAVIMCNFGDASLGHSTSQGAINTAQWIAYRKIPLPIVFLCEDNGLGISVSTPPKWVEESMHNRKAIKYFKCDGLHLAEAYKTTIEAVEYARKNQAPVFLHMRTVRLLGHAGSDIEVLYHDLERIEAAERQDPLLHSARIAIESGIARPEQLLAMYESIRERVDRSAKEVVHKPKLTTAEMVMDAILPDRSDRKPRLVSDEERRAVHGKNFDRFQKKKRNLSQLLNLALTDILIEHKNTVIFGEDVAKKGGVYHVTTGLLEKFSAKRIFNTILDEQSILGTAIGMGHNGFLPIPEIQFLAYYHNAEDQLRSEASTLSFFSSGKFTNPMVLRIASYAYQKGFGGHFHNDNSIAVLRDLPGVILASPSNGADAVRMLRTCIDLAQYENRVVVFLEPIALYMTKDLHEEGDEAWLDYYPEDLKSKIPLGELTSHGESNEFVIVTYSNGYYLSRQAQQTLEKTYGIQTKVVDLRWLAPLNSEAILNEVRGAKHVVIVDECRKTGSISEELVTLMVEGLEELPKIKRITGHDSFIPLGTAWEYVLPSKQGIVDTILELRNKR